MSESEKHRANLLALGCDADSGNAFWSSNVQKMCLSCADYAMCDKYICLRYDGEKPCGHCKPRTEADE